jgi:hypothetical protein
MSLLYIVRCNFSDPDLEEAWNTWYSGPKLAQMLAKPLFISGQRFKASALHDQRRYLALWHVESEQAFQTPEYKSDWGFFEWSSKITDWSRDLFAVDGGQDLDAWRIAEDEFLYLISFEGMEESQAQRELDRIRPQRPGVTWFKAVGLDKHAPFVGLRRLTQLDTDFVPLQGGLAARETIFTPISHFATSPATALERAAI